MGRLVLNILLSFAQFEREIKTKEMDLVTLYGGRFRETPEGTVGEALVSRKPQALVFSSGPHLHTTSVPRFQTEGPIPIGKRSA